MDDRTEHEKAAGSTPDATPDTAPGRRTSSTAPEGADDVAFARLQAADPAAGADPNLPALYAAVSERTGVAVAAPGDELAARRARRAPRWLQVAAVVAGVAVIGGGSYAYGLNNAPETVTAAPAISLEQPQGAEVARDSASLGGVVAGGEVATNDSSKLMYPGWAAGRCSRPAGCRPRAARAPPGASTRRVRTPRRRSSAAAAALGVSGQPRLEYGSWTVGPNDGSGASVSLSPDGLANPSYYDSTRDPWNCVRSAAGRVVEPDTGEAAEGTAAGVPEPAIVDPPADCTSSATAPTGDAAVAQAKDTLSALASTRPATSSRCRRTRAARRSPRDREPGPRRPADRGLGERHARRRRRPVPLRAARADVALGTTTSSARPRPSNGWATRGSGLGRRWRDAAGGQGHAGRRLGPVGADRADRPCDPRPPAPAGMAGPGRHARLGPPRRRADDAADGCVGLVPTYELADADGVTWSVIAVADDQLDFSAVG